MAGKGAPTASGASFSSPLSKSSSNSSRCKQIDTEVRQERAFNIAAKDVPERSWTLRRLLERSTPTREGPQRRCFRVESIPERILFAISSCKDVKLGCPTARKPIIALPTPLILSFPRNIGSSLADRLFTSRHKGSLF